MSIGLRRAAQIKRLYERNMDLVPITYQEVTETRSASGDVIQTWADLDFADAHVNYGPGREGQEGSGEQARLIAVFRAPYRSDITNKHRIVCKEIAYDILAVHPLGANVALKIDAQAKVA